MKIGLVGNCTIAPLAIAFQQMRPDVDIYPFEAIAVWREKKINDAAEVLKRCDIVLAHKLPKLYESLSGESLAAHCKRLYTLPNIVFTGFHPDCIYLNKNGVEFKSPLASMHSAIVAAGYFLGYDEAKTIALFNSEVFEKTGYFDEFSKARKFLAYNLTTAGLDFDEDEWRVWLSRGSFMHTFNHPRPFVSNRVARLIAIQLGWVSSRTAAPEPLVDDLGNHAVWPVYPELAGRIGIPGDYLFKKHGGADKTKGYGAFYKLEEFVRRSFAMYRTYEKDVFVIPAVERIAMALSTAGITKTSFS